jgi:hypothetical protein
MVSVISEEMDLSMSMCACFASLDSMTLARLQQDPAQIHNFLAAGNDAGSDVLDIDKAWHGIHYLLTGSAEGGEGPLAAAIFGGEEIGDDVGYGPARFLSPSDVKVIHAALAAVGTDGLASRYAPQEMASEGIYPDAIWVQDEKASLEYLLEHFKLMLDFYAKAAARGHGLMLWVG